MINIPKPSETAIEALQQQLRSKQFKAFRLVEARAKRFCELRGQCSQDELTLLLLSLFQSVYQWSGDVDLEGYVDGL